jgi:peptidoglycan/LPS O-acetylase OafA/YrhL
MAIQIQMSALKYRPAIDGMRTLAILAVFIFHLNKHWLPGGFMGVDLFFVLSGYLITSIIHRECLSGSFDLWRFYQRRASRIFPAFAVVGLVTLAGSSLIYSARDAAAAAESFVASWLSLANIKFMLTGDYFLARDDAMPFLHCWSLSVEEQFYIGFSLFLLVLYRFKKEWVPAILVFILTASFVFCVYWTKKNTVQAFFLLPSRAWELLAGCVLAVMTHRITHPRIQQFVSVGSIIGVVTLLVTFAAVPIGLKFPGAWPLIPVISAVMILANSNPNHPLERLLGSAPMASFGKISYSLYLWHWPIFAFVDYQMLFAPEWQRVALKCALSLTASVASYTLIENPTRHYLNADSRRRAVLAGTAFLIAAACFMGNQIGRSRYLDCKESLIAKGGIHHAEQKDAPKIMIFGDSHAAMYSEIVSSIAKKHGVTFTGLGVAGKNPLPNADGTVSHLWEKCLSQIKEQRPDQLVFACRWELRVGHEKERLKEAIDQILPYTKKIILVTQPPVLPAKGSREGLREGARPPFFEPEDLGGKRIALNDYIRSLKSDQIEVIDIAQEFINPDGSVRFLNAENTPLYFDWSHLSDQGLAMVRRDFESVLH